MKIKSVMFRDAVSLPNNKRSSFCDSANDHCDITFEQGVITLIGLREPHMGKRVGVFTSNVVQFEPVMEEKKEKKGVTHGKESSRQEIA